MSGRIIECSRCQVVEIISERFNYVKDQLAHYYCADCLIEMMPQKVESPRLTASNKDGLKGVENRVSPRSQVFAPIRLSPVNRGIEVTSALIIDTSMSGVCIVTRLVLHPGEDIIFTIPGAEKNYHAAGQVVYSNPFQEQRSREQYQVGIKLSHIIDPKKFEGLLSSKEALLSGQL